MKYAIALLMLVAFGVTAQAHLTPFQGTGRVAGSDLVKPLPDSDNVRLEREYYQAPAAPIDHQKAGRCTVSMFIFTKIRLAQACY